MFEAIFERRAGQQRPRCGARLSDRLERNPLAGLSRLPAVGDGNLLGGTVAIDQAFIIQMMLPAFETVGVDLDIRGVAHALSIDETRIIIHAAGDTTVDGTDGTDFFYMSARQPDFRGGRGADFYFVGRNSGDDYHPRPGPRRRRRAALHRRAVDRCQGHPRRAGPDPADPRADQLHPAHRPVPRRAQRSAVNGKQVEAGVNAIVFADGVVWDRFRMAMEVVDKERAAGISTTPDVGSGSADILWGGKGNDVLSGGAGGDIYVFRAATARTSSTTNGGFSLRPGQGRHRLPAVPRRHHRRQSQAHPRRREQISRSICSTPRATRPATASRSSGQFGGVAAQSRRVQRERSRQRRARLHRAEPDRALHLRRRQLARIHRDRREGAEERQDRRRRRHLRLAQRQHARWRRGRRLSDRLRRQRHLHIRPRLRPGRRRGRRLLARAVRRRSTTSSSSSTICAGPISTSCARARATP